MLRSHHLLRVTASSLQRCRHNNHSPLYHYYFSSSSRKEPRFRVPAHVAAFTLLLTPVLVLTLYAGRYGPTDEDLEHEIRERYQAEIQGHVVNKNKRMAEFFHQTLDQKDAKVEHDLDTVLKAGKGAKKRLYAVDEKLYGTAQGVAEKKRVQEEMMQEKKRLRKRKRKEQKQQEKLQQEEGEVTAKEQKTDETKTQQRRLLPPVEASSVVTVVAVATLAAAAGFLAGGGRRSS